MVVLVALVDGLHKAKKKTRNSTPTHIHAHAHEDNGEGLGAGYWRGASTCLSLWKTLRCSPPHLSLLFLCWTFVFYFFRVS